MKSFNNNDNGQQQQQQQILWNVFFSHIDISKSFDHVNIPGKFPGIFFIINSKKKFPIPDQFEIINPKVFGWEKKFLFDYKEKNP